MKKIASYFAAAAVLCLNSLSANAEVKLPNILSGHMVLQRGRPIHLWGWADPGEKVTVTLRTASASTTADGLGHWSIFLPPEQAGGPYQVTIAGTNTIVLDDVMIGDVWFASGQSNMQMPLEGFPGSAVLTNGAEEIRNSNHPSLRLLRIPDIASPYPQQDQPAKWTLCTPETAASFSAVAYFFGREIAEKEHVTVGLIDSSWGGTPGEAWISMDSIGADASLMPIFEEWANKSDDYVDDARRIAMEKREDDEARGAGKPLPEHDWHPNLDSWNPAWLYNGMVAPAINYPIRGVIWYQGEANTAVDRAAMYQRVFPTLIQDWRKQWQQGSFPFLYVQISAFTASPSENWPAVREAQRRTLALRDTGMAVTIDIGTPDNVHPPDKQDVGHRLALAARALTYGGQVEYSGPMYRQARFVGDQFQVWFDHTSGGLVAKGGKLTGFEIAGEDKKYVPADARIEGNAVVVSSTSVPEPRFVRYGWANAPVVNLFNGAGLPASPFTSEKEIPAP